MNDDTEEESSDDGGVGTPPLGDREPFIQTSITEEDVSFDKPPSDGQSVTIEDVVDGDVDFEELEGTESSLNSLEKEDIMKDATVGSSLQSSALLVVFAVAALGISAVTGGLPSVSELGVLATTPLESFSLGGLAAQYAVFALASAVLSPLGVAVAGAAGITLRNPDMEAVAEMIPFAVPYISFQGGMEEVVFRGIPFLIAGALGFGQTGLLALLVIGTIPWILMHESGQYVNTAVLGVFFVLVWWGGYWQAGILVHVLHNLLAGIALLAFSD